MTLDDLFPAPDGPRPGAAPARKCRRHDWYPIGAIDGYPPEQWGITCIRCGHRKDEALARRGRTNRSRGNAIERAVAKAVGGRRTGQFGGKDDVLADEMFAFQVKSRATASFPGWMAAELDALRAHRSDREPVLVVAEAPGPGRRSRRLYVVDEPTWLALHGPSKGVDPK